MRCADPPIIAQQKHGERQRQGAALDLRPGPIPLISFCLAGVDCPAVHYVFGP